MLNISPVFHEAPTNPREAVEENTYALLEKLHIPFERVDHDEAQTMDDCVEIGKVLDVDICKNLVLTPRNRSSFYLLCLPGNKHFLTKDFSKQIGSSRLSFATAEDMEELLGVRPGSASVLALMNDPDHRVHLAIDRQTLEAPYFGCHPCRNTSSLKLKTADVLEIFLKYTGHTPTIVEL
ncbi:MAG: prolyl-tRNA synthetase associated domain-containing protein [Clostridiales bacterium]|nr:prolyl-tRNA synthetase associated domain-containing protein [Candidatus Cacconaster stercorequi]